MLNFSLEARLVIYLNKTINPPIKIKNKRIANQFIPVIKASITQISSVCVAIEIIADTGCLARVNKLEIYVDRKIIKNFIQEVVYNKNIFLTYLL